MHMMTVYYDVYNLTSVIDEKTYTIHGADFEIQSFSPSREECLFKIKELICCHFGSFEESRLEIDRESTIDFGTEIVSQEF